jgi:hypothetical protein
MPAMLLMAFVGDGLADGVRLDEGKAGVWSTGSIASCRGRGKRLEELGQKWTPVVVQAVVSLHGKIGEKIREVRTGEGNLGRPKGGSVCTRWRRNLAGTAADAAAPMSKSAGLAASSAREKGEVRRGSLGLI